jgi:hypothetical protein
LRRSINETFERYARHQLPEVLPEPPEELGAEPAFAGVLARRQPSARTNLSRFPTVNCPAK